MEKEIATELEYDELTKTGKVLVDFYADWCGPCQMLTPIIKEIADEHPELTVLRVNVDKVGEPAARLNVYSIPALFVYEDGKIVASSVGYRPKESLEKFLGF